MKRRVCIVAPSYLCSLPRPVKEADALEAAGFDVRVVHSLGNLERQAELDRALVAGKRWRADAVRWSPLRRGESGLFWRSRFRHYAAKNLPSVFSRYGELAAYGEGRVYGELARLAAAEPADLYIGHYPDGLAAAAHAARRHGGRLGYDIEDLYTEDKVLDSRANRLGKERVRIIENRHVRHCRHLTAVSRAVGDEFAKRYGTPRPVTVRNVFPWADRALLAADSAPRRNGLSLYWFSKDVGPGRGIEDAIRALALLPGEVKLTLRGHVRPPDRRYLDGLSSEVGVKDRVRFADVLPPERLLEAAAEHDAGLALELPEPLNRALAVTNKFFMYFLAGLAVAATDLPGQRAELEAFPEAGFLYPSGDAKALAAGIQRWLDDPSALDRAKRASLEAARTSLNWETECRVLVDSVRAALA